MTCPDVQALSGSFLDGELPEEMCDRVQRHLLRCSACREEIDSLRMASEVLVSTHAAPAVSEEFLLSALETLGRGLDVATRLPPVPGQLVLGIGE